MPDMTALQACVLQGYTPGNPLCKFTGNTMDNSPVYPDSGFSPKVRKNAVKLCTIVRVGSILLSSYTMK
jgi:hypothetical protein